MDNSDRGTRLMRPYLRLTNLFLSLAMGLLLTACGQSNSIRVDAIHVSGERFSGDAYVVRFPEGETYLVDTGFVQFTRADLIPFLQQENIERIDKILVTHAHRNHYEGLLAIAEIADIGEIYFNLPNRTACDRETWGTGCNYEHVVKTMEAIKARGIPLNTITADQRLYEDTSRGILFETLYYLGGETLAVEGMSTNDESIIARLSIGEQSMLFTGDIGPKAGHHLIKSKADVLTDVLTLPHHGVTKTVPNNFIKMTQPSYAVASNSAGHWLGKRGDQLRNLMTELKVPTYNTGTHGNIHIDMAADKITIVSDKKPAIP